MTTAALDNVFRASPVRKPLISECMVLSQILKNLSGKCHKLFERPTFLPGTCSEPPQRVRVLQCFVLFRTTGPPLEGCCLTSRDALLFVTFYAHFVLLLSFRRTGPRYFIGNDRYSDQPDRPFRRRLILAANPVIYDLRVKGPVSPMCLPL